MKTALLLLAGAIVIASVSCSKPQMEPYEFGDWKYCRQRIASQHTDGEPQYVSMEMRHKILAHINRILVSEKLQPILLLEKTYFGPAYSAWLLTDRNLIFFDRIHVDQVANNDIAVSVWSISDRQRHRIQAYMGELQKCQGDASSFAFDAPIFFVSVWQEGKLINSFQVSGLNGAIGFARYSQEKVNPFAPFRALYDAASAISEVGAILYRVTDEVAK